MSTGCYLGHCIEGPWLTRNRFKNSPDTSTFSLFISLFLFDALFHLPSHFSPHLICVPSELVLLPVSFHSFFSIRIIVHWFKLCHFVRPSVISLLLVLSGKLRFLPFLLSSFPFIIMIIMEVASMDIFFQLLSVMITIIIIWGWEEKEKLQYSFHVQFPIRLSGPREPTSFMTLILTHISLPLRKNEIGEREWNGEKEKSVSFEAVNGSTTWIMFYPLPLSSHEHHEPSPSTWFIY